MDSNFEQARSFFQQGLAHYQAGRWAQAEQQFAASLAILPGRVSSLVNLGAARLKLGRIDDALAVLDEALVLEPDSADALAHRGTALAELGRHGEALAAFDRSLALDPAQGLAWSHRGSLLRELGRLDEAAVSYERAIQNGADPELTGFYLAALRGDQAPPMPLPYVQALFDGYAGDFESHLDALGYDAPAVLAKGLAGRRFQRGLDLGCGTGACAKHLAPLCEALDGVDLSQAMVDRSRATGAYASVTQAELVAYLQAATQQWDLAVAADVLIYVGALDALFAALATRMAPGGVFAFTVERAPDTKDVVLRPSLRYAHSAASLRRLAQAHGFTVQRMDERAVREEQRVPVPGLFCWLQKT
jgi:predicted TPR repeat methyltransferase